MSKKSALFVATLAAIAFLYTLDRMMLPVLAEPIKRDLAISDSTFGVIIGILFSTTVTLFSIPVARLADRTSRTGVLAGCLLCWSVATAACGLTASSLQLAMARMGVAAGESAATSIMHSLIGARLSPQRRAFALSMVGAGVYLGTTSSFIFGGWLGGHLGWRVTLMLVAIPGILLALSMRRLLDNGMTDFPDPTADRKSTSLRETLGILLRSRAYILVTIATVLCGGTFASIGAWQTAMAMRSYGISIGHAGLWLGLASGLTGIGGQIIAGFLCSRQSPDKIVRVPAIAFMIGGLLTAFAFTASDPRTMVLLLVLPGFLSAMWYPALFATLQNVVPGDARAQATSISQVCIHIFGNGLGPTAVGLASDALSPTYGTESLRIVLIGAALVCIPAGLVMLALDRTLRRSAGSGPAALAHA